MLHSIVTNNNFPFAYRLLWSCDLQGSKLTVHHWCSIFFFLLLWNALFTAHFPTMLTRSRIHICTVTDNVLELYVCILFLCLIVSHCLSLYWWTTSYVFACLCEKWFILDSPVFICEMTNGKKEGKKKNTELYYEMSTVIQVWKHQKVLLEELSQEENWFYTVCSHFL